MDARRVIAISPDATIGKQIATALKAAGAEAELVSSLADVAGELDVSLVVLHLDGDLATAAAEILPRLTGDARAIAVIPRSNLAAVVDVMQSSERLAGLLVAESLDVGQLSAMATRVIAGDIFGIDKIAPWGTRVQSTLVGDYQEKSACITELASFAEGMSVRRKYREAIEQCLDEMLMNALYDAPVDEHGQPLFPDMATRAKASLPPEQKVVVQYACDGQRFCMGVRDTFGTLERATVLRYLHKCLHNEQQIDRKAGGAGLGLYLMASSASTLYFNVLPGVATEAVCVFDLTVPKLQLRQFGFFTEKTDDAGRLAARDHGVGSHPVERRRAVRTDDPRRRTILTLLLSLAIVLVFIAIAAVLKFQ